MENSFFRMIRKLWASATAHKMITAVIAIALVGGGYLEVKRLKGSGTETRYVTAAVLKGTVVSSITGSGQASVLNQVDIKAKASGDVLFVGVREGQEVGAGALLYQLDSHDAQKTVRDAEANLESAKLSLQKLVQPADALSVLQSENTLARAQESKQKALEDIKKAYEDGFNSVANDFLDLPPLMSGLQDMLYGSSAGLGAGGQWNIDYYASTAAQYDNKANGFKADVSTKYQTAQTAYTGAFAAYKAASRSSDTATVDALIGKTYDATRDIAEAVKSANNLIQLYKDTVVARGLKVSAVTDTHLSNLTTYTGTTNNHLSDLLSIKNTIQNDKDITVNADRTIAENTQSLSKLQAGADALDVASAKLSVTQRENALLDARETLANYNVRAPFSGTVAKLLVKKADSVGSGTVVATLITRQKLAQISLNEIDAAKIAVGQKATITFDALPDLSVSGVVGEVDTIGTVTQGVVTYAVKIGFDTQDARVKSGMSVSAAIITAVKQDVLEVQNGAIKSRGTSKYVQVFDAALPQIQGNQGALSLVPPREVPVEVGLSNDTMTEIISGLKEGDQVVTRTITGSATAATTGSQAPSLFGGNTRGFGGGGGGGGGRGG